MCRYRGHWYHFQPFQKCVYWKIVIFFQNWTLLLKCLRFHERQMNSLIYWDQFGWISVVTLSACLSADGLVPSWRQAVCYWNIIVIMGNSFVIPAHICVNPSCTSRRHLIIRNVNVMLHVAWSLFLLHLLFMERMVVFLSLYFVDYADITTKSYIIYYMYTWSMYREHWWGGLLRDVLRYAAERECEI